LLGREEAITSIQKRQAEVEERIKALRERQKALVKALADKGGVTGTSEGVLKAMLALRDER